MFPNHQLDEQKSFVVPSHGESNVHLERRSPSPISLESMASSLINGADDGHVLHEPDDGTSANRGGRVNWAVAGCIEGFSPLHLFVLSSRCIQLIAGCQKGVFVVTSCLSEPGECFLLFLTTHVESVVWVVASNFNFSEDLVDGVSGSKDSTREAIVFDCLRCKVRFSRRVAVCDAMHSLACNVHLEENSIVVVEADGNLVGSEFAKQLGQSTLRGRCRSLRSTTVASMSSRSKRTVWKMVETGHCQWGDGLSKLRASGKDTFVATSMGKRGR